MAESQKYGRYVGGHFGWQCQITMEECPPATHTWNRKPACKACKIARKYRRGEIQNESLKTEVEFVDEEFDYSDGVFYDYELECEGESR